MSGHPLVRRPRVLSAANRSPEEGRLSAARPVVPNLKVCALALTNPLASENRGLRPEPLQWGIEGAALDQKALGQRLSAGAPLVLIVPSGWPAVGVLGMR